MHAYEIISICKTLKCKFGAHILKTFSHICNHVKTVRVNANTACSALCVCVLLIHWILATKGLG